MTKRGDAACSQRPLRRSSRPSWLSSAAPRPIVSSANPISRSGGVAGCVTPDAGSRAAVCGRRPRLGSGRTVGPCQPLAISVEHSLVHCFLSGAAISYR